MPLSRTIHPVLGLGMTFILSAFAIMNVGFIASLTTSFVLAPLTVYARVSNDTWLANSLPWFSSPIGSVVFESVFIIVVAAVMIFGSKLAKLFNRVVMVLALLGIAVVFVILAISTPSSFQTQLNSFAGSNFYNSAISSASAAGYSPPSDFLAPTVLSLPLSFFLLAGWSGVTYIAGEIKHVNRSLPLGMIGGMLAMTFVYAALPVLMQNAFGDQFIRSAIYLYNVGSSNYTLSVPPWAPSFVPLLNSSPIINIILLVSYICTDLLAMYMYAYIVSRHILAWSFDRAIPSFLGAVNERFHSPIRAVVLTIFLGWLAAIFYTYLPVAAATLNLTYLFISFLLFDGLAGFALIWKSRDLLDLAPGTARKKIGNIPVVSILGLCDFILVAAMLIITALNPLIFGPLTAVSVAAILGSFLLATISYFAMKKYLKHQGIDLSFAFKEIPPE